MRRLIISHRARKGEIRVIIRLASSYHSKRTGLLTKHSGLSDKEIEEKITALVKSE